MLEVDGDIDAAIEFLVAEQGAERDDLVSCNMDSSLCSKFVDYKFLYARSSQFTSVIVIFSGFF